MKRRIYSVFYYFENCYYYTQLILNSLASKYIRLLKDYLYIDFKTESKHI